MIDKKRRLEEYLRSLGGVFTAYSAGVDSTFLLKVAHDVLGDNAAAVTASSVFFPKEELDTLRKYGSRLQGHPDCRKLPGVEVSTGSLGQGLSIAAGMACGLKLQGSDSTVFTLLGDGECQEGQVWEAATFAAHQKLDNLVAIVDANGLQIDGNTYDVCQVGDLGDKFAAFGWDVCRVDGHDIAAMVELFNALKEKRDGKPHMVIETTVKGKGVSYMEGQAGWHGKAPNAEEASLALAELEEGGR